MLTSPQLLGAPGMDPNNPAFAQAHQQAMLIAKQAYQFAVAQQAMKEAGDEWERGSSVSGWGGGGASRNSLMPDLTGGGMGMLGAGMGMGGQQGMLFPHHTGGTSFGGPMGGPGMMFPTGSRSVYGGSEYGGFGGADSRSEVGGGWGSRSVYGESFGPSADNRNSRASMRPPMPTSQSTGGLIGTANRDSVAGGGSPGNGGAGAGGRPGPRPRTRTAPSSPQNPLVKGVGQTPKKAPGGGGLVGHVTPPSSWRGPQ